MIWKNGSKKSSTEILQKITGFLFRFPYSGPTVLAGRLNIERNLCGSAITLIEPGADTGGMASDDFFVGRLAQCCWLVRRPFNNCASSNSWNVLESAFLPPFKSTGMGSFYWTRSEERAAGDFRQISKIRGTELNPCTPKLCVPFSVPFAFGNASMALGHFMPKP